MARITIEDFSILKPISAGAFGKVSLCRKKVGDEKVYAVKVVKKADIVNKNMISQLIAERDILSVIHCPFIVHLYYSLQTTTQVFFVMDYMIGGDVKALISQLNVLPEQMAIFYVAEVAMALDYLHSLYIIHRDIKPDNMLISKTGHIKLTDFGLSHVACPISISESSTNLVLRSTPRLKLFHTPGQISSLKERLYFDRFEKLKHQYQTSSPVSTIKVTTPENKNVTFLSPIGSIGNSSKRQFVSEAEDPHRHFSLSIKRVCTSDRLIGKGQVKKLSFDDHPRAHESNSKDFSEESSLKILSFSSHSSSQTSDSPVNTDHSNQHNLSPLDDSILDLRKSVQNVDLNNSISNIHDSTELDRFGINDRSQLHALNGRSHSRLQDFPFDHYGKRHQMNLFASPVKEVPELSPIANSFLSPGASVDTSPPMIAIDSLMTTGNESDLKEKSAVVSIIVRGTPDYLAPEILKNEKITLAVDWWALGACFYEFLYGSAPFSDDTPEQVFDNILNHIITWDEDGDCQGCIERLLDVDPVQRPNLSDLKKLSIFEFVDFDNIMKMVPPFIPQPDNCYDTAYFEPKNKAYDLNLSASVLN